jgi:hypothetical protein
MNIIWLLVVVTSLNPMNGYILKNKFHTKEACEQFIAVSGNSNQFCTSSRTLETDFIKE